MKFMNMKRFASTVLAGALALSMAAPAFATAAEKNTTNIAGTYTPITLAVTVPSTGKAIINPYGLPYTLDETNSISGQQITTGAPLTVQNRSSVALSVSAKLTGDVPSGSSFAFSATAPTATETATKGQVIFQMFPADALTEANLEDSSILFGGFANLKDADALPSTPAVVDTTASDVADILVLREGKDGELQAGGAAYFRLSGKVAQKAEWKTTDTFSVKVAFTFTPSTYTKDAGTIAGSGAGIDSIGTAAVTLTLTPVAGLTATLQNTEWTMDGDEADYTLAPDATDPLKAKISTKSNGSAQTGDKVNVTVTITDANGVPYVKTVECTVG